MKNGVHLVIVTMSILLVTAAFGANPFLNAKDDEPVSASVRGTEWNDEYIKVDIPLAARMVTTRIAPMSWGRNLQNRIRRCAAKDGFRLKRINVKG